MNDIDVQNIITQLRADITNNTKELVFDPIPHKYYYKGEEMKSVSVMCEIFKAPFDTEYWSKKKAKQLGISQQAVLESWNSISQKACDEGSEIHAYGEWNFYNNTGLAITDPDIQRIGEAVKTGTLKRESRMEAIDDVWKWLSEHKSGFKLYPVAAENKIVNPELGYAGTFDLLFLCVKDSGEMGLIIFDYKTNKNLLDIYKQQGRNLVMMQYPFHNIPDCSAAHYTCQLSLYQLGLQRLTNIPVIGRVLFWVNPIGSYLIEKNDKDIYKEVSRKIEASGETSKWKYITSCIKDIDVLKKYFEYSRVNRFGILKLPYYGNQLRSAILESQEIRLPKNIETML